MNTRLHADKMQGNTSNMWIESILIFILHQNMEVAADNDILSHDVIHATYKADMHQEQCQAECRRGQENLKLIGAVHVCNFL